jgi:Domain of unknown function (DUF4382)
MANAMSTRKQVITAGVLALAIALATIVAAALIIPQKTSLTSPQTGTSSHASSSVRTSQGASTTTQPTESTQGVQGAQGEVDVLLTDPPTVPANVTAIYVTYANVAVHLRAAGNQSGWTNSNTSGTIDLMKLVNVSTTIAVVKASTGFYDALRFNISSASVTYNGMNYTAFVPRAELTVTIPNGIEVNETGSSAALIDMHPTVLNIGSRSDPEFIVDTAASCLPVPRAAITASMGRRGFQFNLGNMSWWTKFSEQYSSNIQITGASLTANSMSVTIKNTGNQSVTLSAITLAPIGGDCAPATSNSTSTTMTSTNTTMSPMGRGHGSKHGTPAPPLCFAGSEFFLIDKNGTLTVVSGLTFPHGPEQPGSQPANILANIGESLAPGDTITLTYSGSIHFGFFLGFGASQTGITSGDQYQLTVVGQQALAQYVVVAS